MKSVIKGLFLYQVETAAWPLIDLYEMGDDLVFEIDLPGIEPEYVSIRAYEDMLIIEGMRTDVSDEARIKYICMERDIKGFRRVVNIPVPVNTAAGEASYSNGVITVKFPKKKDRLIEIRVKRKGI